MTSCEDCCVAAATCRMTMMMMMREDNNAGACSVRTPTAIVLPVWVCLEMSRRWMLQGEGGAPIKAERRAR